MPSFVSPFNALVEYFQTRQPKLYADSSSKSLSLVLDTSTNTYFCGVCLLRSDTLLYIIVKFPVVVGDATMRALAAEVVARVNDRLAIGRLNIDMSDGTISVRISHLIGKDGLDDDTIDYLVQDALRISDRYFGALMLLIYGGHTPSDAVYVAELDMHVERADAESDA